MPATLCRSLEWGAMGIPELKDGRFGFAVDLTDMDLEADGPCGIATCDGPQGARTLMVPIGIHRNAEADAGARINSIGAGITATGPLGNSSKAILGCRAIHVKFEIGAGLNRLVSDGLAHGPTAGVQLRL